MVIRSYGKLSVTSLCFYYSFDLCPILLLLAIFYTQFTWATEQKKNVNRNADKIIFENGNSHL